MLDPRFFMYYEETEWCVRIARAGYRIVVNPRAVIWHAIDPAAQEGQEVRQPFARDVAEPEAHEQPIDHTVGCRPRVPDVEVRAADS